MQKDKVDAFLDYVLKHSKIVFPVVVVASVAVTVSIGLNANRVNAVQGEQELVASPTPVVAETIAEPEAKLASALEVVPEPEPTPEEPLQTVSEEIPLVLNESDEIRSLVLSYCNACAMGDYEALASLYDELSENDMLRYVETARYLDYYPAVDIYTKPGPAEGSMLAYVYYKVCFVNHEEEFPGYELLYICEDGQGGFYIKNENNFTEEEKEYILKVSCQDDAVEFNNRVNAEYNDMMETHPELLAYLHELGSQVDVAIGEALRERDAMEASQEPDEGDGDNSQEEPIQPSENLGPQYAVATTTVNVRSSDSEQADKLGKITGGTRIQVQEVQINGWTKVIYEGNDGYIKSEYLMMEEPISGEDVIGMVTAIENVKIRAAASLEGETLGLLVAGESLELLGNEDGWCKVKFNDRVAYVKAEYVSQ